MQSLKTPFGMPRRGIISITPHKRSAVWGMMRRMLDSGRINALGWRAKTDMRSGLEQVCNWYLKTGV